MHISGLKSSVYILPTEPPKDGLRSPGCEYNAGIDMFVQSRARTPETPQNSPPKPDAVKEFLDWIGGKKPPSKTDKA